MREKSQDLLPMSLKIGSIDIPPLVTEGALKLIVDAVMNEAKTKIGKIDSNIKQIQTNLSSHNHDDRYAKLEHTHKIKDIGSLDEYKKITYTPILTSDTIVSAVGKLETGLELPNIFGFEVDEKGDLYLNYNSVTPPSFEIDEDGCLYYNFPEGNKQNLGKVVGDGGKVDLSSYQKKTDDTLNTTSKEVVGAINENKANIDNKLPLTGGTISGALTVTGDILSNGNVTAFSDRRIKENIEPIENALEKVKQLQGITYNLIGSNKKQVGLIAQDVQKVLPEVVVENHNGILSLDYSRIVALLINAINELSEKVGD